MARTVFVSGGSRGIGRGILEIMASPETDVAFTYHSQEQEAQTLADKLRARGGKVFYRQSALEEPDAAEELMDWVIASLGHLDVLVCNAGLTVHQNLLFLTEQDVDFCYHLDYRSYLLCAKTAIAHMKQEKIAGRVIFITSSRGSRVYPEDPLYGGMKAALDRACQSLALECAGTGITVNCVAPGNTAVRGSMEGDDLRRNHFQQKIPVGRAGTPKEVGCMVDYLSSQEAGYITGCNLRMDGGLILPAMPEDASEGAGDGWHVLPPHLREKKNS